MNRYFMTIAVFFSLVSFSSVAGIIMGGTRIIYNEGDREASLSVTNADSHVPYLVQSWIENYSSNKAERAPFIVTPPLFRLDPEQKNILRITFTGSQLPTDRESVFWLNVKSISPSQKGISNKLQVNIKSMFKIFYRPAGLPGDPATAWEKLEFHCSGRRLIAVNPTPRFISFYSITVADREIDEPGMIAPLTGKEWPVEHCGQVKWRAINDFGGISDYAQR